MPLVRLRRASDIHFAAVRQRQTNVDLVQAAGLMAVAGTLDDDPARRNAAIARFKLLHQVRDLFLHGRTGSHILEF